MRYPGIEDPADLVVAWEAVEDLLAAVPESTAKDVLRMVAAGMSPTEIAEHLGMAVEDVEVHAARARIRVLTAALPGRKPAPRARPAAVASRRVEQILR
jgi:DNA-directed RNA polymerase specialized sigma24 family protein